MKGYLNKNNSILQQLPTYIFSIQNSKTFSKLKANHVIDDILNLMIILIAGSGIFHDFEI